MKAKKGLIAKIGILLILISIVAIFIINDYNQSKNIPYSDFVALVEIGNVDSAIFDGDKIIVRLKDGKEYKTTKMEDATIVKLMHEKGIKFEEIKKSETSSKIINMLLIWGPLIIVGFLVLKMVSKNLQNSGILNVIKTNKKKNVDKNIKITFKDVAGQDEAKESLKEVIDILSNPKKYKEIGAKVPRGTLLIGPPGTGKTLLAKAVAGEAKVPFYSLSGSDFVEMFAGVGASRVRDLFAQAKENSPSIIFIDEIDTIGKKRDSEFDSGDNSEREQTLNALLSEMDGFDNNNTVIIGATNRPDCLDKALLRAGRFDRIITVDIPDIIGREGILNVHLKKIITDDNIDIKEIAKITAGCSGADIANIVNEAALEAVRKDKKSVSQEDLFNSIENNLTGKEKRSIISKKEKEIVAYHEIGHALIAVLSKEYFPIQKITIVPRTKGSLGYTMQVREEEKYILTKEEMLEEVKLLMGGRATEDIILKTITTGAANDIQRASGILKDMITIYGMNEKNDFINYTNVSSEYLDKNKTISCSESIASKIDIDILKISESLYKEVLSMINNNEDFIHEAAKLLLEKETISGDEFLAIVNKYKIKVNFTQSQKVITSSKKEEKIVVDEGKKLGLEEKAIESPKLRNLKDGRYNKEKNNKKVPIYSKLVSKDASENNDEISENMY